MANEYEKHAILTDHFETTNDDGDWCYIAVSKTAHGWPFLTVTQRFWPSVAGFAPGIILVPETNRLFIGAGDRLLAYDLETPKRLWEDFTDMGFWSWSRHDKTVLMSAELELAAWDLLGNKLWTTFVEPPWEYDVADGILLLDVMGVKSSFNVLTGPNEGST